MRLLKLTGMIGVGLLLLTCCQKEQLLEKKAEVTGVEKSYMISNKDLSPSQVALPKRSDVEVWGGIYITDEESGGGGWPDNVVPCWNVEGVCMIVVRGDKNEYGLEDEDLPAVVEVHKDSSKIYKQKIISDSTQYAGYYTARLKDFN